MPDPEQLAREDIDRQLCLAGWIVQDRAALNLAAGPGVAIREVSIPGAGEADYLLVAQGKAVGIIEAKKRGETLTGVEVQTRDYARQLPAHIKAWTLPLPMLYESTGVETRFTNLLDPEPRSRPVFGFHTPQTLARWASESASGPGALTLGSAGGSNPRLNNGSRLKPTGTTSGDDVDIAGKLAAEEQERYDTGPTSLAGRLRNLPAVVDAPGLWPAQLEAITQPRSVAAGEPAARPDPDGDRQRQDLHRRQRRSTA